MFPWVYFVQILQFGHFYYPGNTLHGMQLFVEPTLFFTFLCRFLKEFLKKTSYLGSNTVASLNWIFFEESFRFFFLWNYFLQIFQFRPFFYPGNTLHGTQLLVEPTPFSALKSLCITVYTPMEPFKLTSTPRKWSIFFMVKSGELGNSLPLVFRGEKLHATHPPHREPKQKYAHLDIFFGKNIFFSGFLFLWIRPFRNVQLRGRTIKNMHLTFLSAKYEKVYGEPWNV